MKKDQIVSEKPEFLQLVKEHAKDKNPIYWKGYMKVERLKFIRLLDNKLFIFISLI